MKTIIMSWSKCDLKIGKMGTDGAMSTSLASVGVIKDKSCTLESSEGDALEAVATGGETVAKESLEGNFTLSVRVIEPDFDFLTTLGIGTASDDTFNVATHLIDGYMSVEVTPKNVGATGLKAPCTNMVYKPGWSEEEGRYADLTFEILHGPANYWYSLFKKASATE